MANIYASLNVSPRKKRTTDEDDNATFTPKRLRTTRPPTPKKTPSKVKNQLPGHLVRLYKIQLDLQNVLSHALATHGISPASDTGRVRNVLNHLSLSTYTSFTTKLEIADLKRLCWLWEWDEQPSSIPNTELEPEDPDPFLDRTASSQKDWTRGKMGIIISPTTHNSKGTGKREPAYGLGIELEIDLDKGMGAGFAAIAGWTAESASRLEAFRRKLERWMKLHSDSSFVPNIPLADLPPLPTTSKQSALTRELIASSPKGSNGLPSPPILSPAKSPTRRSCGQELNILDLRRSPTKNSSIFPETPSRRGRGQIESFPSTPQSSIKAAVSIPASTPVTESGRIIATPWTPSTPRQSALYERILKRSQSASPTKVKAGNDLLGGPVTREQFQKMSQAETRRRRLMSRLVDVAESVWSLFMSLGGSAANATPRKRRARPASEVAHAIEKSLQVSHFSSADVNDALDMLTELCPFFLRKLVIASEEWYEMPTSYPTGSAGSSLDAAPAAPSSPGPSRGLHESAEEVFARSPKSVKREGGGLRAVREIIRREIDQMD